MVSDDLTALAAISIGALASAAVTFSLMFVEPAPRETLVARSLVQTEVVPCVRPARIVDFAIIRGDVETMVGPEGHDTGWRPAESLEMRLLRSR